MARNSETISFIVDNVKDGEGNLQMRVRWESFKVGVNLGYKVEVPKWDADSQRCVANTTHSRKKISAREINREIMRYEDVARSVFDMHPRSELTAEVYRASLRTLLGRKMTGTDDSAYPLLFKVIQENGIGSTRNTIKGYSTAVKSLQRYLPSLLVSELGSDVLKRYEECAIADGMKNRSIRQQMVALSVVMRRAGIDVDCKPRLKVVPNVIVWLTWDELMKLYNAPAESIGALHDVWTRDLFCLSCFTGLRYSDITQLMKADDLGTHIRRTIIKTGEVVYIETNKYSRAILDRYRTQDGDLAMPWVDSSSVNKKLKEICKAVGIDSPVCLVTYKGKDRVEDVIPKYEALTFHCGRKTFICNALSMGIPPQVVMRWTGHKNYNAMRPYIDISDRAKSSAMALFDDRK